ncbi:MAG: class I SAM-dependent methyltransferase [Methanoregula sp.]|uniref:methyltransferase domain-containing protein n=1 Tax=Methanoregula sp. TaxID=2052170 RepID=UPI002600FECF|nr:methyltransferase domain-containing protein [Methanoregula sp.]MCK9630290.1 class I SAM-dependent methyltransferase [Methanoregula sp.]
MKPLLDVGMQPISNRYLCNSTDFEKLYHLVLGQCQKSGLIKLMTPFPNEELKPRYDWITYREPEGHLDYLVNFVCDLEGVSENSKIGGLSFKDDTTLHRFRSRRFETWRLDPNQDLNIHYNGAGIESIQSALTTDTAKKITQKYGKAEILIARHILEHVYNLDEFINSLKTLVAKNAFIIFEVPDCTRSLEQNDYTTIWEEHLYYFTPETFKFLLAACGLQIIRFENIQYPFENSLIAITRPINNFNPVMPAPILKTELLRGEMFAQKFGEYRKNFYSFFAHHRRNNGKIAFFGAGHLACTFVWLFQLQDFIDCIIDDDPNKQGLFMPGSKLPIVSSSALMNGNYSLCILSLNPLNEDKVIANFRKFIENGGKFYSIFPSSQRSLHKQVFS